MGLQKVTAENGRERSTPAPVVCERFDNLGADGRPVRLGIMGGTFDPIHIGHLACAEQAREAFGLDAVVFIPAGKPAFKLKRDVTPAEQRFEMCRLAVRGNPAFDVSRIEIDRPGVTYTADTLRELREHYPGNVSLFFITGADAVCSILKWRESAAIASMAELIAATRPGYALSEEARLTIEQSGNFRIHMLETTGLAVSSSDLRARVHSGRSIRYLTMQQVLDYIAGHGLYGWKQDRKAVREVSEVGPDQGKWSELGEVDVLGDAFYQARREQLKHRVKHKRFEHSLGVSETAARMARVYGQDERLARLAGLLHDWDKAYDDEGIRARAVELGVAEQLASYMDMPHLLHGPTAAAALAREFPELPSSLLQAIRLHTTGAVGMSPLDLIVYVADVIEPTRDCPGVDQLRDLVGKVELEELFLATLAYVIGNLIERRKLIHSDTVTVWNHYVARAQERGASNDVKGSK